MVFLDIKYALIPMTRLLKNSHILIGGIFLHLAGCQLSGTDKGKSAQVLPFINQPDFTPEWIDPSEKRFDSIHIIPAFSFTDQEGKIITEKIQQVQLSRTVADCTEVQADLNQTIL